MNVNCIRRLLVFKVEGHMGNDIGKIYIDAWLDWGINKVMTVTVDNAGSNDGVEYYILKQMSKKKLALL